MLFSPSPKRSRLQLRVSERRLLLMTGDIVAVVFAVIISLRIWAWRAEYAFDVSFIGGEAYWFVVLPLLWLMLAGANDYYELSIAKRRGLSIQRLIFITIQLIIVYLLVFFFSPREALPRLFILYYGISSFMLLALWRMLNPALIGWAASARHVILVGTDESAALLIEAIRQQAKDVYAIYGVIGDPADVGKRVADVPVIGGGADLLNYVLRDQISELIITDIPEADGDLFRGLMDAYERGVELVPMPLAYSRITGRIPVEYVKNNWVLILPLSGQSIFNVYPVLQRALDLFFGVIGFVVFAILYPFIALAIRLDSKGTVFYTQVRTGLNGRNFHIYKYRTMAANAEADGQARFSQKGDLRVTRVGRFLRATRLDELPQVLNILRGDMSIVGPRPERPEHIVRLEQKIPFYRTRLVVRPGLTGWAQVRYNYGSDDHDALVKLEYDLYYIRNQSIVLDLNIIIRTVYKVLRMEGI